MAGKLPAFQFYPGDWRKDPGLQSLDLAHRGAWLEMLCIMHESQERGVLTLNGKPMPTPAIARQLGITADECEAIIETLLDYGVAMRRPSDGAICSRRMIRDEEARIERKKKLSDAGRRGAQKKWGGDRVGHAEAMPDPKPGPCSENSSSSSSSPSGLNTENSTSSLVSDDETPPRHDPPKSAMKRAAPVQWDAEQGFSACSFRRLNWAKAYPLVDLNHELAKAHAWYLDNPARRKRSHTRFLGNWLSNAQERAEQDAKAGAPPRSLKSHAVRSDSYNHAEDTSWLTEGSKSA